MNGVTPGSSRENTSHNVLARMRAHMRTYLVACRALSLQMTMDISPIQPDDYWISRLQPDDHWIFITTYLLHPRIAHVVRSIKGKHNTLHCSANTLSNNVEYSLFLL